MGKVNINLEDWQAKALKEYFAENDKTSVEHWAYEIFNKALLSFNKEESVSEKITRVLDENDIDWQSVHLSIMDKGYVIISEEEYDNLEPINHGNI